MLLYLLTESQIKKSSLTLLHVICEARGLIASNDTLDQLILKFIERLAVVCKLILINVLQVAC